MKISDLEIGHVFIYYPSPDLPVVAIKSKSLKTNDIIPIIPVERYFYVNQELTASIISPIEDYMTGIGGVGRQEPDRNNYQYQKIEVIPPGSVVELNTELSKGIPIIVTNNITIHGQVVLSLGNVLVLSSTVIVEDCGHVKEYNGLIKNHIKICPNCGRASLVGVNISQRSSYRCNFCGMVITITV